MISRCRFSCDSVRVVILVFLFLGFLFLMPLLYHRHFQIASPRKKKFFFGRKSSVCNGLRHKVFFGFPLDSLENENRKPFAFSRQCASVQCASVQCASVQCASVQCASVQCASVQCASVQCASVHPLARGVFSFPPQRGDIPRFRGGSANTIHTPKTKSNTLSIKIDIMILS